MLVEGKVAIVLGGAGGMGKAVCKALLSKGAKVCCGDILDETNVEDVKNAYPNGQFIFVRCDSTKDDELIHLFERTVEHFTAKPEIVLTTVGVLDEYDWQRCVDVNIGASIRLVNVALSVMSVGKGGKGGSIVLTSSVGGLEPACWGPVYCATKHAQIGLARSWAEEKNYKVHGIRFNLLCPEMVDSPFLSQIDKTYFWDEHLQRIQQTQKITPETVAEVFMRIVDNDAMNGAAVRISFSNPFQVVAFPDVSKSN